MRNFARAAFSIGVAALLAACSGSQPPIGAPDAMHKTSTLIARASSANYKVLYSFSGGSDGANPYAGLIKVKKALYGTTFAGGSYYFNYNGLLGCGTVFSVTLDGVEQVLFRSSFVSVCGQQNAQIQMRQASLGIEPQGRGEVLLGRFFIRVIQLRIAQIGQCQSVPGLQF